MAGVAVELWCGGGFVVVGVVIVTVDAELFSGGVSPVSFYAGPDFSHVVALNLPDRSGAMLACPVAEVVDVGHAGAVAASVSLPVGVEGVGFASNRVVKGLGGFSLNRILPALLEVLVGLAGVLGEIIFLLSKC